MITTDTRAAIRKHDILSIAEGVRAFLFANKLPSFTESSSPSARSWQNVDGGTLIRGTMIYGLDVNGMKVQAVPHSKALCPSCNQPLISKCGTINIWHWAHEKGGDCDAWSEGETEWHLNWKSNFPAFCTEFQIVKNNINHRADVCFPTELIIEFQHSSLSVKEIQEREQFYQNMIWVFDIRDSRKSIGVDYFPIVERDPNQLIEYDYGQMLGKPVVVSWEEKKRYRFEIRNKGNIQTFRWKHAKKSIAYANCPVYLDLGNDQLFQLIKMYPNSPVGGKGYIRNKAEFIDRLIQRNWV